MFNRKLRKEVKEQKQLIKELQEKVYYLEQEIQNQNVKDLQKRISKLQKNKKMEKLLEESSLFEKKPSGSYDGLKEYCACPNCGAGRTLIGGYYGGGGLNPCFNCGYK